MEHPHLLNLLTPEMEKLGYTTISENTFVLPLKGFIIMSHVVRRIEPARFDIILAVIFTHTTDPDSWKNYGRQHAKMETSLYDLLLKLDDSDGHLDLLFQNKEYEINEAKIKENLPAIIDLFKAKVIPYFEKWNDPFWLIKNFKKEIYGRPFYVCLSEEDCIKLFRQQIGGQILSSIPK